MNIVNNGNMITGGTINANNFVSGDGASIHIGNQTNNKWIKVDNWIQKNRSNIKNYEALQEQINILKTQIDTNISKEKKESVFKKIIEAVGFVEDALSLIELIKKIF